MTTRTRGSFSLSCLLSSIVPQVRRDSSESHGPGLIAAVFPGEVLRDGSSQPSDAATQRRGDATGQMKGRPPRRDTVGWRQLLASVAQLAQRLRRVGGEIFDSAAATVGCVCVRAKLEACGMAPVLLVSCGDTSNFVVMGQQRDQLFFVFFLSRSNCIPVL